jgi:acetyl-CoA carboxylase biotin carboxyl carrier protein
VSDLREKIDLLADLMEEYNLDEAKLEGKDWSVSFSTLPDAAPVGTPVGGASQGSAERPRRANKTETPKPTAPQGTPITSPMMGIFYTASSPGTPPFAKPGDKVSAGQVVGLVEAMKVFNEITTPVSGTVLQIYVENAQLVQPGTILLTIG